ncbi:hypothetical protein BS47DRAFT_1344782 [Hydnum rufescens UP504]|uniref:Uncharacterized protein n=1 Tax=Hydnum rufescens UP504 TaxID=1448309 RepID=A0A9P6AW46_9AGAM|nr:hypothetical protein BS47DRAFT_1344782 [Hydnum rufescens UP504]
MCLQRAIFAAAAETSVNDDTAVDSESLDVGSVNPNPKRQQNQWRVFIQDEYTRMKRWTDSHISDSTSMQYLAQVIRAHLQLALPLSPSPPAAPIGCADQEHEGSCFDATDEPPAMSHVLSLLRTYPSHEAIWMCLRQSKEADDPERAKLAHNMYAWLPGREEDDNGGEHDVGSSTSGRAKIRSGDIRMVTTTMLASEFAQTEARQTRLFRKRFSITLCT